MKSNATNPYLTCQQFCRYSSIFLLTFCIFVGYTEISPISLATTKSTNRIEKTSKNNFTKTITSLQKTAESIASRPALSNGRTGIYVASITTGQQLANIDGAKLFQPASNLKLYTTATALDKLGPDFRIRTSIYAPTPNEQGIISGDLILYGRGDPNLSDRFNNKDQGYALTPLENLADQVVASGIKHITGDLIGDESYFQSSPLGNGWEWNDLQWYYGTEISALSSADNQISLSLTPSNKIGEPCEIKIFPFTPIVKIINRTKTCAKKDEHKIGIHRGLADNVIEVWGNCPLGNSGMSASLAVHDPALFTISLFKQILVKRGIIIDGIFKTVDANLRVKEPLDLTNLKEVAYIDSPSLSEMIHVINKKSQNLHAELLLRQIGKLYGLKDKDCDEAGTILVKNLLKRAGVETSLIKIRDGSGLSRLDYVSPESTAALLIFMYRHQYASTYIDSLPIAGIDGTLGGRMGNTKAANNLRAKTGTLDDASSLSGYVTAANGEVLVFSLLTNHLEGGHSSGAVAGNILGEAMANYNQSKKLSVVAINQDKQNKNSK